MRLASLALHTPLIERDLRTLRPNGEATPSDFRGHIFLFVSIIFGYTARHVSSATKPVIVISADQRIRFSQFFNELILYRDLFIAFVERDLKVRYKQTMLGVIWVLLQPLVTAGAFSLIFGKLSRMPSENLPYLVFYILALVPWSTFAAGLSAAANSMESSANLISKVYFPRIVIPSAYVAGTLVDYLIGFALANAVLASHGLWTPWFVLAALVLLPVQIVFTIGLGVFLAALNAQYRDVKYTIPFMIQIGMLATPVIYPLDQLPGWLQHLMILNPMAGIIESYRGVLNGNIPPLTLLAGNALVTLITLIAGVLFFKRREEKLVDIL